MPINVKTEYKKILEISNVLWSAFKRWEIDYD